MRTKIDVYRNRLEIFDPATSESDLIRNPAVNFLLDLTACPARLGSPHCWGYWILRSCQIPGESSPAAVVGGVSGLQTRFHYIGTDLSFTKSFGSGS
jgi:hypothetical protein